MGRYGLAAVLRDAIVVVFDGVVGAGGGAGVETMSGVAIAEEAL